MKKGFTLVEIIIAITLVLIIGTTSLVFFYKKDKDENPQEKFLSELETDTLVYYDINKNVLVFSEPDENGDSYTYIKLKDLIDIGILDEKKENPFNNNKPSGESSDVCIKITKSLDGFVNILYNPEVLECRIPEEDLPSDGIYYIKVDASNEIALPSSSEALTKVKSELESWKVDFTQENIENYSNYYQEAYYGDFLMYTSYPRAELVKYVDGGERDIVVADIYGYCDGLDIYNSRGNYVCPVYYKYPSSGEYFDKIKNGNLSEDGTYKYIKKEYILVDNDAPILISSQDYNVYADILYYYYPNSGSAGSLFDSIFYDSNKFLYLDYSVYNISTRIYNPAKPLVFDNYDGLSELNNNMILLDSSDDPESADIRLIDSNDNEENVSLDVRVYKNQAPKVDLGVKDYYQLEDANNHGGTKYIFQDVDIKDPEGDNWSTILEINSSTGTQYLCPMSQSGYGDGCETNITTVGKHLICNGVGITDSNLNESSYFAEFYIGYYAYEDFELNDNGDPIVPIPDDYACTCQCIDEPELGSIPIDHDFTFGPGGTCTYGEDFCTCPT